MLAVLLDADAPEPDALTLAARSTANRVLVRRAEAAAPGQRELAGRVGAEGEQARQVAVEALRRRDEQRLATRVPRGQAEQRRRERDR